MITRDQIKKSNRYIKVCATGNFGSGKTHLIGTFPKFAYLCTEPGGIDTITNTPELLENLVWMEDLIPSPTQSVDSIYRYPRYEGKIYKAILKAHEDFKKGTIKTIALDNGTYTSEGIWMHIDKNEPVFARDGVTKDTRGQYGVLGRRQFELYNNLIMSFPGNVIVTFHESMEGDEAMMKKPDKTTPVVPNILGGFRGQAEGFFSACLYLRNQPLGQGKFKFNARCMTGDKRRAKNRYNLPEFIENISYSKIMECINARNQVSPSANTVGSRSK